MKTLRLTGSGVRGFVGESLTPQIAMSLAGAFGTLLDGGRILVGRDTRLSSPVLDAAVKSSLMAVGCEVLDAGVCPLPVLQHQVAARQAAGAIAIGPGHAAMGWNALTLIDQQGAVLDPVRGEAVLDLFHAGDVDYASWDALGPLVPAGNLFPAYLDALEDAVDGEAIRKAGFTVVIDPVGGAGASCIQAFADRLGFNAVAINADPTGYLPREPEPRPRSALQAASIVPHVKADAGFVFSSDMGRLSLVSEAGYRESEEMTFPLIADHLLARLSGTVVTNGCSSRMVDDLCRAAGRRLVKTRVGQPAIAVALADEEGVLGGEGSGSVCLPSFSLGFDGFLMAALILEALAVTGDPLSVLLSRLPTYHIIKKNRPCDAHAAYHAVELLKEMLQGVTDGDIDLTDGIRIDWETAWVHIRPSHTEQIIRIITEATTREEAEARAIEIMGIVEEAI